MAVFLGQDGTLSMGNKTPVTILQETLQKRGITPHYELIYNGTGTIDPIFKYQVSAVGLMAIGDGKTKKEAKHDAAAALLRRMQTSKAVTENADVQATESVDIASPYAGTIKENYVGLLDEVCFNNKTPEALYMPVREEGPPHARVFTMRCKVGSVSETAVARTKKQAKHLAAQRMVARIAGILGDKYTPVSEKSLDTEDVEEVQNFPALEAGSYKEDLSIPVSDFHNSLLYSSGENPTPVKFLKLAEEPEEFYEQMESPLLFLEGLLEEVGLPLKVICMAKEEFISNLRQTDDSVRVGDWSEDESSEEEEEECSEEIVDDHQTKRLLEELHLSDSEEELSATHSKTTPISEYLKKCNLSNCDSRTFNNITFLRVESPVGPWAFRGIGESEEEATKSATLLALKAFRIMSIPKNNGFKVDTQS